MLQEFRELKMLWKIITEQEMLTQLKLMTQKEFESLQDLMLWNEVQKKLHHLNL